MQFEKIFKNKEDFIFYCSHILVCVGIVYLLLDHIILVMALIVMIHQMWYYGKNKEFYNHSWLEVKK